ncbi:MAG: hypothetical protein RLZZ612_1806 [Pseudomonadota bacterium]|jgi:crotonobetainyl-CoA:carnitine CoA-transferase CaiB-like acyl-CoA transferase
MMGGLAYMTGRPGDPLRVGSRVSDIVAGVFGAIGAVAAFAPHMIPFPATGQAVALMPIRLSAWAIHDVFNIKDDEQIFLAGVSNSACLVCCSAFGFVDVKSDPRLQSNNDRVKARDSMLPLCHCQLVLTLKNNSKKSELLTQLNRPIWLISY